MTKTAVFDLDGTLVDSVPDIAAALNRLLVSRDLAGFAEPEVQAFVGDGVRPLLERAFAARGVALDEAALDAFMTDYTSNAAVLTRPYPGVVDTLSQLRDAGWNLAVCTNKPVLAAREVLQTLGLAGFFAAVGGGDSYPVRKPNPAHLLAALAEAGGDPARAVMVGDHHNDIHAAAGAGVFSIWAKWGYGAGVDGANAEAAKFADIVGLLPRWG